MKYSNNNTPQHAYRWGKVGIKELIPRNAAIFKYTFKALRNRNFALYFSGQFITLLGSWMQQVAMGYLVYKITDSVFLLSLSVFLTQIPVLFVTPFAGVVADRFDRKKVLLCTQSAFMVMSALLAVLTYTGFVNLFWILTISLAFGVTVSFDAPTRQSIYSKLVPPEDLSNAIALNATAINGTKFIGPAVGGVIVATVGETACFTINFITYWATLIALFMINADTKPHGVSNANAIEQIKEGISYAKSVLPIRALLILLATVCFWGAPLPMLLPAFVDRFGGGSEILGNMMSLIGLGSLAASLYLASRKSVLGLGKLITLSSGMLGVGIMVVSLSGNMPLTYFFCVPMGFGLIATTASCNTLLQSLVDDNKRGRIMSLFTICFFGMQPLGSLLQGYLSKLFGMEWVLFVAGAICVASAVVFEYFRPSIRKIARAIYCKKDKALPEIAESLKYTARKSSM